MRVVYVDHTQLDSFFEKSVCCIGYFDGLHKGHQKLVQRAVELSKKEGLLSGIITFDPDPWKVFKPDLECKHLTSLEDKIELAKNMGLDVFYILYFSKAFASLGVDAFHYVLHQMRVEALVCGFDFHYGNKNVGDVHSLKKQPYFSVEVVDCVHAKDQKIASSRIEPLIEAGDVYEAAFLSGFIYSIQGTIVHGYKRGSDLLKIPTANLLAEVEYILPQQGVYAGLVSVEDRLHMAMINIGLNPTFENRQMTIEAHILDFHDMIYDSNVRFYFLKRIRDEVKFDDFSALKQQLLMDIETSRAICLENQELIANTAKTWNKSL